MKKTGAASWGTAMLGDMTLPSRQQTPEDVRAFFAAHRTVRQYQPYAMPPADLDAILYAAQRAPTDATAQLYSFIHLTDPAVRKQAAQLTGNAHLATASATFVVCLDIRRVGLLLQAGGEQAGHIPHIAVHFGIGDAALAGQNMLLAAEMLGYQGCWVGGVISNLPELLSLLSLPTGVLPYAALTIGRSAEDTPYRPRLPRDMVVHQNQYRDPTASELLAAIEQMNPIAARSGKEGDWLRLLKAYFGETGGMVEREPHLQAALERQGLK